MATINLTGTFVQGVPAKEHLLQSYLRPYEENGERFLDAQIAPRLAIKAGDVVYSIADREGKYHPKQVAAVLERRPCIGQWKDDKPLDFVKLQFT